MLLDEPCHLISFIAVPPPGVVAPFEAAWRTYGTGQPFRSARQHLTIYPAWAGYGEVPASIASGLLLAGGAVRTATFTLTFDALQNRGRRGAGTSLAVVAREPAAKGHDLHRALHLASLMNGVRQPKPLRGHRFDAHVTLTNGWPMVVEPPLPTPIEWTIDEIVLVDSLQAEGRHDLLGRWPLSG